MLDQPRQPGSEMPLVEATGFRKVGAMVTIRTSERLSTQTGSYHGILLQKRKGKRVFDLVKDFGTSESPKSTRAFDRLDGAFSLLQQDSVVTPV